jgi:hypothetical protein
MAASDARPIPRKNTAYRLYLPILDADGDLVTGATGLDSDVSIDGGTFADCTNEATEIATSSGMYYLDLTAAELNGDAICIIVKTSSSGAKTTPVVLYPEEAGDIRVDVVQISGDSAAADNLEAAADGTGYNLGGGSVVAASVTGAVGSVTGNVGGNVSGSVGSLATQAKADVNAEADAALADVGVTTTITGRIDVAVSTRLASAGYTAPLDAAGVRSAVGLANADLDTQLGTIDNLVDDLEARLTALRAANLDNLDATISSRLASVSYSAAPTANQNADAWLDRTDGIETGYTPRQVLRLIVAALAGELSGAATTTITLRNITDTKARITATVDADGNRTAVTYDVS